MATHLSRCSWRGLPVSARREKYLYWPASGEVSKRRPEETEMEAKSCANSGETGAGTSPFPETSHSPCRGWSEPPNHWF
jgi:hypothetical protein